jgi:hypothetical protein
MSTIIEHKHNILAEVPNNADMYVEKYMLDGVRDMCRGSWAYKEAITDTSVATQSVYPVTPVTALVDFVDIISVKYKNKELPKLSGADLDYNVPTWETRTGTPQGYVASGVASITFDRVPDTSGDAIRYRAAIMPNDVLSVMPLVIENNHLDGLLNYVLWKIYSNVPFRDLSTAAGYRKEYIMEKTRLKVDAREGYTKQSRLTFCQY